MQKQLNGLEDEMAQLRLGGLIGENKAGLKVYKFIGQGGTEFLTTIDGKTGEVVKRITKQPNPDKYPWYKERGRVTPKDGKSTIVNIEDFKTGETIYKVRSSYKYPDLFCNNYWKHYLVESVTIKNNKISKTHVLQNAIHPDDASVYYGECSQTVPGVGTIVRDWNNLRPQRMKITSYSGDKVEITDKYLLDIMNKVG